MKKWIFLFGLGGLILWWKRHDLIPAAPVEPGPAPRFRTSADRGSAPVTELRPAQRADADADDEAEAPTDAEAADGTTADDLQRVKGIGPVYAGRLAEKGITSFAALAAADSSTVAAALDVAEEAVDDWKQQAAELA